MILALRALLVDFLATLVFIASPGSPASHGWR